MLKRFQFEERDSGLTLSDLTFNALNLLVGYSGAGKTTILRLIQGVALMGSGRGRLKIDASWEMVLQINGQEVYWGAEMRAPKQDGDGNPTFIRETVRIGQELTVDRGEGRFLFQGRSLPRLKESESALSLLQDEDVLAPVHQFLSKIFLNRSVVLEQMAPIVPRALLNALSERFHSFEEVRAGSLDPLLKFYVLQKEYPEAYERLFRLYSEIFEDVTWFGLVEEVAGAPEEEGKVVLVPAVKVRGVLVKGNGISAGMLKTWMYLLELYVAPPDSLIMIDEVENSLGANCLPQVCEAFGLRSDLQLILTSHHPQLISDVPLANWKIVRRRGATVSTVDAADIKRLQTAFKEKFPVLLDVLEDMEEEAVS